MLHIHIYIYVCVCVCIYIYIYSKRLIQVLIKLIEAKLYKLAAVISKAYQ